MWIEHFPGAIYHHWLPFFHSIFLSAFLLLIMKFLVLWLGFFGLNQAGIDAIRQGHTRYTPNAGTLELRKAICHKFQGRTRKFSLSSAWGGWGLSLGCSCNWQRRTGYPTRLIRSLSAMERNSASCRLFLPSVLQETRWAMFKSTISFYLFNYYYFYYYFTCLNFLFCS